MENRVLFTIIIGFFVVFLIFIVGLVIFILKVADKNIKEKEELKRNKPPQKFEYVDFFFYNINETTPPSVSNRTYGYFVIRDIETSIMYAIHSLNANVSYDLISALNIKKMSLYLNTTPRKEVQFGSKGCFWISEILNSEFYFRKDDEIKIGQELLKYIGNIESVKNIGKYNGLYNLNPLYDISLLDNVKFIDGIVEFNVND